MRKDMAKCLVEDGRRGGYGSKGRRGSKDRNGDFENAPKRESTGRRRCYGWNSKELNETLNPLERFLLSCVGRLWDKVYSEIREHLAPRNAVQMHIMQHLWGYVDRDVVLSDCGIPVRPHGYSAFKNSEYTVNGKGGWIKAIGYRGRDFWIHPRKRTLELLPVSDTVAARKRRVRERVGRSADYVFIAPDGKVFGRRHNPAFRDTAENTEPKFLPHWYEMLTRKLAPGQNWGKPWTGPWPDMTKREQRFLKVFLGNPFVLATPYVPRDYYVGEVRRSSGVRVYGYDPDFFVVMPLRQASARELARYGLRNEAQRST